MLVYLSGCHGVNMLLDCQFVYLQAKRPKAPAWMKKVPDLIQSKRITKNLIWSYSWLALCDSHGSGLLDYFGSMGMSTLAIHGGMVSHAYALIDQLSFFDGDLDFLLICLGGNDIADFTTSVADIASEMGKLLAELASRCPNCIVVTGSVVPRVPDRHRMEESAETFLERADELDRRIEQVSPMHHHFNSDLLIGGRWLYGTLPRLDLYNSDLTHLNDEGLRILTVLLDFVLESVNFGVYNTRREFPVGNSNDFRTFFWSF